MTKRIGNHYQVNLKDEATFEQILKQLSPMILATIRTFYVNIHDKEDIYQEVMVRIYRALRTFDFSSGQPFEHYVRCLIRSVKYDYLRKQMATERHKVQLVNEYIVNYDIAIKNHEVEYSYLNKLMIDELMSQFKCLSYFEKQVLELRLHALKPKAIARQLNVEEKVVYNAIQRYKRKLKQNLIS